MTFVLEPNTHVDPGLLLNVMKDACLPLKSLFKQMNNIGVSAELSREHGCIGETLGPFSKILFSL